MSELFGREAVRWFPAISILLWVLGIFWALRQAALLFGKKVDRIRSLILAEGLVLFTLYEAPNRFQILYWRAGLLTYLMPLVFFAFLAGLILFWTRRNAKKLSWIHIAAVGLLGFYSAGFSETSGAWQTTALVLGLLSFAILWRNNSLQKRALILTGAALSGSLLALLVLYVSPAAHSRQALFPTPPNLITIIRMSAVYAYAFFKDVLVVLPLPTVFGLMLTMLLAVKEPEPDTTRTLRYYLTRILLGSVFCFLLCMSFMAPSVFAYQAMAEGRAAIVGRFLTVSATFGLGWLLGQALNHLKSRFRSYESVVFLVTLVLLAAWIVYPIRITTKTVQQDYQEYQRRAAEWDARDTQIRSAIAGGETHIEVVELDSIGSIQDLQPDPGHWVNKCAARFYGIDTLQSYLPGSEN